MRGARPAWDQVQQPCRGMFLPSCQVHDAGKFTWAPAASVLMMPHASRQPPAPARLRNRAGSSHAACRHGLIWDHTVFHVVPNWRASPEIVAPSKRNCRIAQRIARVPRRAQGGAHPLVMFQERHRLAGAFAAHPASLNPPEPCRDPGPGCVDHLHHHATVALYDSAHNPGIPPAGCTTQHRVPEHLGCEPHSSDGSPPSRRADHTDHNDQATHSSSR